MIVELLISAALAAPASFKDCDDCPEMIVVPAGAYMIGATDAETDRENMAAEGDTAAGPGEGEGRPVVRVTRPQVSAWEKPATEITIAKPFAIGKYEVTLAEYRAFVVATNQTADGGCRAYNAAGTQFETIEGLTWRAPGFAQTARDPVVCVNWLDAQRFVEWLSFKTGQRYRLPTEAEWEYAARAGTTTSRHWGEGIDQACDYANVGDRDMADKLNWRNREFTCRDGFVYTAPVGSYKANAFGLHDMLGNVWEMIEDCWHWNHAGRPTDSSAWESKSCTEQRMNKGGSWSHFPWGTRSAVRNKSLPTVRFNTTGFRVVKDLN